MSEALIIDAPGEAATSAAKIDAENLNAAQRQAVRNALWSVLSKHLPRGMFKRRACSFCSMPAEKSCLAHKCTAVACAKHRCRCSTENEKAAA